MRINGEELLSRATLSATRNLLIADFAIVFLKLESDATPKNWNLLGQEFSDDTVLSYGLFILVFLSVGHLLSWGSDFRSFILWYRKSTVSLDEWDRDLEQDPLKATIKQVGNFISIVDRLDSTKHDQGSLQEIETLTRDVALLKSALKNLTLVQGLRGRFREIGIWALLQLFGWYLVVPYSFALMAMLL